MSGLDHEVSDPLHGEGRDGLGPVTYRERLVPPWWLWLCALGLTGSVGVAYGAAYGSPVGWTLFVAGTVVLVAVLLWTSPPLRVDDAVFRAGRARLPLRFVGAVEPLDVQAARAARTTEADGRAHLLLRTWTSGRAVRVHLTDPQDPHPYWLVTTRRPEQLADALRAATLAPAGDRDAD